MRFDDRVTGNPAKYATQAKVIHIDIDPAEINKIIKADVPLVTDAKLALESLLSLVEPRNHSAWIQEFKVCDKIELEKVIRKDTMSRPCLKLKWEQQFGSCQKKRAVRRLL